MYYIKYRTVRAHKEENCTYKAERSRRFGCEKRFHQCMLCELVPTLLEEKNFHINRSLPINNITVSGSLSPAAYWYLRAHTRVGWYNTAVVMDAILRIYDGKQKLNSYWTLNAYTETGGKQWRNSYGTLNAYTRRLAGRAECGVTQWDVCRY